jgi:hypothetical protein
VFWLFAAGMASWGVWALLSSPVRYAFGFRVRTSLPEHINEADLKNLNTRLAISVPTEKHQSAKSWRCSRCNTWYLPGAWFLTFIGVKQGRYGTYQKKFCPECVLSLHEQSQKIESENASILQKQALLKETITKYYYENSV